MQMYTATQEASIQIHPDYKLRGGEKTSTIKEEKDEGKEKEVDGSCELLFETSIVFQTGTGSWPCLPPTHTGC